MTLAPASKKQEQFLNSDATITLNPKHVIEATTAGLELVGDSEKRGCKRYKVVSCGHEIITQPSHVRRNHWSCTTCDTNKVVQLGAKLGLEYLGPGIRSGSGLYKLPCGHVKSKSYQQLRKESFSCDSCAEKTVSDSLNSKGFSLLSKNKSQTVAMCTAGHVSRFNNGAVVRCSFECKSCVRSVWEQQALSAGLVYLSSAKSGNRGLYKLPCGCSKELRRDHVRENVWCCDNCDDTRFNRPGVVYLLQITVESLHWLKLGFSNNLKTRISSYGLPSDAHISVLTVLDFETCREALLYEKQIHSTFKSKRLNPAALRKYHTVSGHTECYPTSLTESIIREFNAKRTGDTCTRQ